MDFHPAFDDPAAPLIPGDTPKCGNRSDLPKAERKHGPYVDLGPDVRHMGDGTLAEVSVRACAVCGADEYSADGTFRKRKKPRDREAPPIVRMSGTPCPNRLTGIAEAGPRMKFECPDCGRQVGVRRDTGKLYPHNMPLHTQRSNEMAYDPRYPQQPRPPYQGQWPPPPQKPPRKKHTVRTVLLLGVAVIATFVIVSVAVSAGKSSSSAPSAGATSAAAPAVTQSPRSSAATASTVTYIVTGSPSDVTYGPAGSSLSGSVPMRKHAVIPASAPAFYSIDAQLQSGGTVTCKIEVNGRVISQATASGSYNIASCEITQDPISGQWQDTNSG